MDIKWHTHQVGANKQMPMRLNGWQRIGVVLLVLWVLGGLSGTIAQELSSQAPEGNEFWPPFLGYRLKITDSLLALFTLLLVIVGAWQGYQLRRTVQSRITGERPQIYPGPFNSSKLLPSGAHAEYPLADGVPLPIIDWTFMNVGKSPGIIREVRGELVLDRLPWRRRFTYSKVVPAELIVRVVSKLMIFLFHSTEISLLTKLTTSA
jgi:hypothetical protein